MKIFKIFSILSAMVLLLSGCSAEQEKTGEKHYGYYAAQVGDTVFTTNYRSCRLDKQNTDGSGHQLLYEAKEQNGYTDWLGEVVATEDWIYFIDENNCLIRMSHDGSVSHLLKREVYRLIWADGWLYVDSDGIFFLQEGDTTLEPLVVDYARLLDVDGGYLYYRKHDSVLQVHRCKADGSGEEELLPLDQKEYFLLAQDGWIYYSRSEWSDAEQAWQYSTGRLRPDGSEKAVLLDVAGELCVADGWMYYDLFQHRKNLETGEIQEIFTYDDAFFTKNSMTYARRVAGDYLYLENQIDDANWYDLLRFPLDRIGNGFVNSGEHLKDGKWIPLTEESYRDWIDGFYRNVSR